MLYDLSHVSFQYGEDIVALHDISVELDAGESVAILGANGSGKSTLLRILSGLAFATNGSVRFNDLDLNAKSLLDHDFLRLFRSTVGFVFQNADSQLFNSTVFDEVAFGTRQMGLGQKDVVERVQETLSFLGIEHLAERPPFRLSGGEKRKVAIASVLSMNPDVVLFDEPFLGLDPRSQSWLVRTMEQLQQAGKTTIVATHTLDIVPKIAETAIVLGENHRLLDHATVFQALSNRELMRESNLIEPIDEVYHR